MSSLESRVSELSQDVSILRQAVEALGAAVSALTQATPPAVAPPPAAEVAPCAVCEDAASYKDQSGRLLCIPHAQAAAARGLDLRMVTREDAIAWSNSVMPAGCGGHPWSSRACERGTRGCEVRHDAAKEPPAAVVRGPWLNDKTKTWGARVLHVYVGLDCAEEDTAREEARRLEQAIAAHVADRVREAEARAYERAAREAIGIVSGEAYDAESDETAQAMRRATTRLLALSTATTAAGEGR